MKIRKFSAGIALALAAVTMTAGTPAFAAAAPTPHSSQMANWDDCVRRPGHPAPKCHL